MKLSCLIPNYNDSATLEQSIDAILSQPVEDVEVIVIDDASTDHSWDLICKLAAKDERIRAFKHEKNLGVVATLMHGFELARGEFIYMGSANDTVCAGFLKKALDVLNAAPNVGFFCGNATLQYGERQVLSDLGWGNQERFFSSEDLVRYPRSRSCCFHGQSVVFRKSCLPPNHQILPELRSNFDLFIFFAIAFRSGFYFSPKPYAVVAMSEGNFSARERSLLEKMGKMEVFLKNLDLPCYSDIRSKMARSGLLSFMGIPLFCVILSKGKLGYFSWQLARDVFRQALKKLTGAA